MGAFPRGANLAWVRACFADAPVGVWLPGSGSGTTIPNLVSVGTHDATVLGGARIDAPGVFPGAHGAMSCDGVDDVAQVAYNAALNPAQFTLECWGLVSGVDAASRRFCGASTGNTGYMLALAANTGVLQCVTYNGTGPVVCDASAVVVGAWYHLAMTYDGTHQRLYVNGELANSNAVSLVANTSAALELGRARGVNGLIGRVGGVALFASALPEARIAAHNAAGRRF